MPASKPLGLTLKFCKTCPKSCAVLLPCLQVPGALMLRTLQPSPPRSAAVPSLLASAGWARTRLNCAQPACPTKPSSSQRGQRRGVQLVGECQVLAHQIGQLHDQHAL